MKKLVYLISPNKIHNNFYDDLHKVLSAKNVKFFQLRLKKVKKKKIISIALRIKKITKKHRVKFIINDDPAVSKFVNADGCHLGQNDTNPKKAREIIGNKIIGMTCHNSTKLIKKAVKLKVDYIALGAFFHSKTKKTKYIASKGLYFLLFQM